MGSNGGQWDTVDLAGLTSVYPQFSKDPAPSAQMMPQLQHAYYMQQLRTPRSQDLRIDVRRFFTPTVFDRFLFFFCSNCIGGALPLGEPGQHPARLTRKLKGKRCQTACKPGSVPAVRQVMAIHLGRPLPDASRDRPGRRRGNPPAGIRPKARADAPSLFGLAPGGVYRAVPVAGNAVRSCRTLSPLPADATSRPAVCFLWHFPWGHPRRALPGTVFPWSPDFPPPPGRSRNEGGHPAVWQHRCYSQPR